uniref:Transcription factor IIIB 50 kDa subunit n=1 Tax=Labrus bergylta TaxID=56723 RepID=A0A3Q3G8S9_9LABR
MSRPGLSCPGCGSSNIVDDALYSQAQLVCVDCGSVVSEGVLADDPVGCLMTDIKTKVSASHVCILRVHSEIEDLSNTYYNQAYQHESFIKVSLQKKEVLAGCCVLVSCRLLNWPITMGTISCLLDVDPMVVGVVYQEMVKVLHITAPIVNVTDVMEASSDVPEEFAEDSRALSKRAVALVELAADTWIVTGRKPIPIMMAAIYLAWQSLKPNKQRLKFSLDKFCQLAKVNKLRPAMKRITEMKEVLCKLGKEIPWVRVEVTLENVILQVGDILNNRYALLRRAMRTHEDALLAECQTRYEAGELSPNWGKRVLFAPPCVVHAKKRRVEQPGLKDVTGDEEISDSEIDSYIRSPREAREFALTQKILSESEKS